MTERRPFSPTYPYRARALLPNEEHIQWIKQDRWIHYSRAGRLLDCLTALLHYPPGIACHAFCYSVPQVWARRLWSFRDYPFELAEQVLAERACPVVSIQMPPADERDFYEEVLVSMGGVLVAGINITTLRHRTRIFTRQLEGLRM